MTQDTKYGPRVFSHISDERRDSSQVDKELLDVFRPKDPTSSESIRRGGSVNCKWVANQYSITEAGNQVEVISICWKPPTGGTQWFTPCRRWVQAEGLTMHLHKYQCCSIRHTSLLKHSGTTTHHDTLCRIFPIPY